MNNKIIAIVDVNFPFSLNNKKFDDVQPYAALPFWKKLLTQFFFTGKNEVERKDWILDLLAYETIILFDTHKKYSYLATSIEKEYPNKKLIFYAWNPLLFSDDWITLSDRWRKLSFSKGDCENTDFEYAGTFYGTPIESNNPIKYDAFFVGLDKGRRPIIEKIRNIITQVGLTSKIILVDNIKSLYNPQYSHYLDYNKVCEYIHQSNAIIDIVQDGQEGMTMRVMEGLFYKKKVITTNKNVVNYDFYNSSNFFVVDVDNVDIFLDFMRTPYQTISTEIINKYKFDNWFQCVISK